MNINPNIILKNLEVEDLRWPTSLGAHGSDAMHTDPDYSCVYVTIKTNYDYYGNGLTFTCGRGTDVIVLAVEALKFLVEGQNLKDIVNNFANFWRKLTSESQLRWIGPEKGVIHLAVASIINAIWDLWAKIENKPVWRLLVDLTPEELVSVIDFRYITDVIKPNDAIELLKKNWSTKGERINDVLEKGYPAYTTQVGWMGYSDDKIESLCKEYLKKGFTSFKIKVGKDLQNDISRCRLIRNTIGWENNLMIDANQIWDVNEAIEWVKRLSEFKPMWIEEPTSPDDILGHANISKALRPLGIEVATGEMCANRVMFKQFLQANAMQYCQIDSARIGGINEILSVYLMAKKFNVKVCPHAGGVGLCEMVQHLQIWDYINLSATKENRVIEYVDQQHEQFMNPCIIKNACYMAPINPGYSTELKQEAIESYRYPNGTEWERLFNEGLFKANQY